MWQFLEGGTFSEVMGIATLLTAAAISSSTLPISAIAANYGGFGSSYAEVIDPKTAVLNDETFKSDDVKAGLDGLLNLIKIVGSLKESLSKDAQADIVVALEKDLSPGKIRSTLNQYNNAFAEDTQRGTDRLIRNVIQDVNELGREASIKPGKQRSAAKLATTLKRLTAAEDALKELAAFYPK
eukprot:gene27740-36562_t